MWKTEYKGPVEWIRFGDTLVHTRNVNTVTKKGDGVIIRFTEGVSLEIPDTPVREVAQLLGFEEIRGDSTTKPE